MAKDPAFLFYSSDFLSGTITMTHTQRGQYITLLCAMHQVGRVSIDEMKNILNCEPDPKVLTKFKIDNEGKYFNERLEEESFKRKEFSESRRRSLRIDNNDSVNIYLIHSKSLGLTKIGSSKYPTLRLKDAQKFTPDAEFIWISPELVERITEKHLHDKFSNKRKRYDWFNLSNEDLEHIKNHYRSFRTENVNENQDEIKDEIKGGVGEKLQRAFDEAYMEKMKLSKAYPGINLDAELATFKVKVISSVEDYQQHDVNGLRKAFNYQLRNAKPKENGITKALKQSAGLKELIRAKYGTEGAKPGTAIG